MEQQLRARVGAARLLLQRNQGSPNFTNLSRLQADAIRDLIQKSISQVSASFKAELAELLLSVAWAPLDGEALISSLTPKDAPQIRTGRRSQQRFSPAFLGYFTESQWASFCDSSLEAYAKLDILLTHSGAIGMRCPAEGTLKMLTSFWMSISYSPDELLVLPHSSKASLLLAVKRSFDSLRRRWPDPASYILDLPSSTVEYMRLHPATFHAVFGTCSPVPSKVSLDRLIELDSSYGCRNNTAAFRGTPQQRQPQHPPQFQLGQQGDIGSILVSLFGNLAQQRQLPAPEPIIHLTGSHQQQPVRRLPTVAFDSQPLALETPPRSASQDSLQTSTVLAIPNDAHMPSSGLPSLGASSEDLLGNLTAHGGTIACATRKVQAHQTPACAAMAIVAAPRLGDSNISNDGGCSYRQSAWGIKADARSNLFAHGNPCASSMQAGQRRAFVVAMRISAISEHALPYSLGLCV